MITHADICEISSRGSNPVFRLVCIHTTSIDLYVIRKCIQIRIYLCVCTCTYTHICVCVYACVYIFMRTYLQEEVGNENIGISILCIKIFFFFVYPVFEQESNDAHTMNYAVICKNDGKI